VLGGTGKIAQVESNGGGKLRPSLWGVVKRTWGGREILGSPKGAHLDIWHLLELERSRGRQTVFLIKRLTER